MSRTSAIILIASVLLSAACTTTMDVNKAGSGVRGIHYSLPRAVLMVTPNPDGTLSFEWQYLPDSSAEYAIETKSYLAKHKVVIDVDSSGLLKKVEWNPQSADVAKALIENSTAVLKDRLDRRAADAKSRSDALAAAQKAVDDAQAELDTANAELAVLEATDKDDLKLAARIKKADAEVKLEKAKKALQALQGASAAPLPTTTDLTPPPVAGLTQAPANSTAPPNNTNTQANTAVTFPKAWGPVFFDIVEDSAKKSVTLKAVRPQEQFDTYKVPDAPKPPAPGIAFRTEGAGIAKRLKSGKPVIVIATSALIAEITEARLFEGTMGLKDVTSKYLFNTNLRAEGGIAVVLNAKTLPGVYRIELHYKTTDGKEDSVTIPFGVE